MRETRRGLVVVVLMLVAFMTVPGLLGQAAAVHFGGRAVEGPRGGEAVEGVRGEAVEGPRGNLAVEGARGHVEVGRRYDVLPDNVNTVYVGDVTYYVDDAGVYYLPCEDDDTVYCVVEAPQ